MFFYVTWVLYRAALLVSLLPISYQGLENIPKEPCIIVANHESSLDIVLLGRILGVREHAWLAKHDLWDTPVIGFMLRRFGIPVVFEDLTSPVAKPTGVVAKAKAKLDAGSTVTMFPEGGRYVDGTIHPFRSGFAVLASQTKKPVVPVLLVGAGTVLPPGKRFKRSPVKVIVGEPFVCGDNESIQEFKQRVYAWFVVMNVQHNPNAVVTDVFGNSVDRL